MRRSRTLWVQFIPLTWLNQATCLKLCLLPVAIPREPLFTCQSCGSQRCVEQALLSPDCLSLRNKVRTSCWRHHTLHIQDLEEWRWNRWCPRVSCHTTGGAMQVAKAEMKSVVLFSGKACKSSPAWGDTQWWHLYPEHTQHWLANRTQGLLNRKDSCLNW